MIFRELTHTAGHHTNNPSCSSPMTVPESHRLCEMMSWKGPLEPIWSNSPAIDRDTYRQMRVLRAPSCLTEHLQGWHINHLSEQPVCQCCTTFIVKNYFLTFSLNFPPLYFITISLCAITTDPVKKLMLFFTTFLYTLLFSTPISSTCTPLFASYSAF